ncbi:hypothetical protein GDO81_022891 [Engystomops pustulosus]|uniref:Uncharacterized protein n=1 Tax=Engystomops pustulosus TaxID=76066 RepID=A0AAV6YRD2_ENGPU|nr:hypothetical protein GDO81_022891 [Engystomops pustulosus]
MKTLQRLGWIINTEKSNLDPSMNVVFLGVLIDSTQQMSFLPPGKRENRILQVKTFQKKKCCSIREAMRILGLMTACMQCVQWSQSHARTLQNWVLSSWDKDPRHLNQKVEIPLCLTIHGLVDRSSKSGKRSTLASLASDSYTDGRKSVGMGSDCRRSSCSRSVA